MRNASVMLSLVVLLAGCGGQAEQSAQSENAAQEAAALPTGPDPCALVSQADMESLIGPLAEPPFRVDSDRRPLASGEGCFYRARDRRNVTILVDWEDGPLAFQMLAGTGATVTDAIMGYDASADTLEGSWDKVGAPFGQLIALKGKTSVHVDPVGSRLGLDDAAQLASIAISRLDKPLSYSGAKATLARKAEPPRTGNPCDLVTRAEAEALMGTLKEDPKPSEDNSACDYVTSQEMLGSNVTRTLKVQWNDGFYAIGQERVAIGGAAKAMAKHIDPDIPTLSTEGVNDPEPWDERITLMGVQFTVVKNDVLLQIAGEGVGGFDEGKALAMLRIACGRL